MFLGGFLHFLYQWKEECYKIYSFNLTVSLHYLMKTKNTKKLHILKSVVTVFYHSTARMCLWGELFLLLQSCNREFFLHCNRFLTDIIFYLQNLQNFIETKVNFHDLWCDTLMTSSDDLRTLSKYTVEYSKKHGSYSSK